jgi:D-alanyl-D-alanine dipeptidase
MAAVVVFRVWLALGAPGADLVELRAIAPRIRLDLRYATAANFTGRAIYPVARCFLWRAVAERLALVQADLAADGLGLEVFDCYRPLSAQRLLWRLVPDDRYVADPAKGSRHNRGAAVDVTLVTAAGAELALPTAFDDFSERAHRDFRALPAAALEHRERLERAMAARGFVPLPTEWWHFDAPDWADYPLLDVALESLPAAPRAPARAPDKTRAPPPAP